MSLKNEWLEVARGYERREEHLAWVSLDLAPGSPD